MHFVGKGAETRIGVCHLAHRNQPWKMLCGNEEDTHSLRGKQNAGWQTPQTLIRHFLLGLIILLMSSLQQPSLKPERIIIFQIIKKPTEKWLIKLSQMWILEG